MNLKSLLYTPEGDSGSGGGAAVADAPTPSTPPAQQQGDLSEMSTSDAIAKVFQTEPRQHERREPRKETTKPKTETPPKTETKPADVKPKVEEKPKVEVKTPEKRSSIFDEPKAEAAPAVVPDKPATTPEEIPRGNWEAANKAREELRAKLKTVESELATYHELVPDREEVKRIREEHKVFSEKLAILNYQDHPEYKKQFTEPKKKLEADMGTILADNAIEGFDIKRVAALPRVEMAKAISEATEKMNSYDAGEFRLALRDYQKLSTAEQAALGTHRDAMAALTQQSQAKQRTAFEGKWKTTSLATFAQKLDPPADAPPEDAARIKALNEGIDGIRSTAERYAFALGDEHQAADVAIKAANYDFVVNHAFPSMQNDYKKLREDYQLAIAQLMELKGQRPGSNFDGSAPSGEASPEDQDIKTQVRRVFRS